MIVKGGHTGRVRLPANVGTGRPEKIKSVVVFPTPPAKPAAAGPGAGRSVIVTDGRGYFRQEFRNGDVIEWRADGSVTITRSNGFGNLPDTVDYVVTGPGTYDVTAVIRFP